MAHSRARLAVLLVAAVVGGGLLGGARLRAQGGSPVAQPGGDLPGDPLIQLVKVAGGLADPVKVAAPNDGSGGLVVVERVGRVRVVGRDGGLLAEPFLDIAEAVKIDFLEQGLLGLAFHPDFAANGRF